MALACDCGTLSGLLNGLSDKVVQGITPPLDQSIREAAGYNSTNTRQDFGALRETVALMGDQVVQAIKALDKNEAERVTERTYEEGSQPKSICGNDALGASLQLGTLTRDKARADILERAMGRSVRHPRQVDYIAELGSDTWPDATALAALGLGTGPRTYSLEETATAVRVLESLSNPVPPPKLPEDRKNTPAGLNYEAQRKDFELRLALYQGVLARDAADRAPTLEGLADWAGSKWRDMGGTGSPPGLSNGLLSQESLFWYLANMRLASANWHEEALPTLPEAGLLRELVAMEAVSLELARRQNELLGEIARLLALDGLENLNTGKRQALLKQYSLASQGMGGQ
jgi:hypothetical protein